HRASIVACEEIMAQSRGVELLEDFPDGEEIAERFRHFFLVDVEKTVMQPVARQRLAEGALGLRDLVLMMRKDQIPPATVNIERLAEILRAHCRALNMPAGAPLSPRTFPDRLARLARFPQREIQWGMFAFIYFDTSTGFKLICVFPG